MQRRGTDDPSGLGIYPNWAMVVAGQPPRAVQPRLLRCGGQALGSGAAAGLVERGSRKWVGNDVPDFKADSQPKDHMGPFIMNPEGVGRIFAPLAAFADGPFPEHYEPIESPIANPLHPQQSNNPVVKKFNTPLDKYGDAESRIQRRLHHLPADRALSLLDQEQSDERAARARAVRRDPARARGRDGHPRRREGEGDQRPRPLHRQGDGHAPHQADDDRRQEDLSDRHPDPLGLSRHRRRRGRTALTPANLLSPTVMDPNAYTPEFKGFLVKMEKA